MDTSVEYIKMCEKAGEIQAVYFSSLNELLPSFIFDKRTRRVSIEIWAPPTLQAELNLAGHSIVISIESNRPLGIKFPEGDKNWSESCIWLPRQDQLQKMIDEKNIYVLLKRFNIFHFPRSTTRDYAWEWKMLGYIKSFTSMEQLWLAFVMKENFNKIWTGEEWETNRSK